MLFGTIVFVNEAVATVTSYLCNGCLLYCVLKNWKPSLKQLNMILVQNIVLDMTYGLFPLLTGMWMSIIDGRVYVLMTGIARFFDYRVAAYIYCLYCAVLALCVFAFPVQFYFRYKSLGREDTVSRLLHVSLWFIMLFLACCVFCGFIFAYSFHTDLEAFDYAHSKIIANYVGFDASMPFVVGQPNSSMLTITFTFALILFILSSSIVVYYSRCISKLVQQTAKMTDRFKHLYLMLHRTLIIQAVIFFAAAVAPAMSLCLFQVLKLQDAYFLFSLGASFFAWTPVINPLVSMYLVRPYRRMLMSTIFGIFGISIPYSASSVGMATQQHISKISMVIKH